MGRTFFDARALGIPITQVAFICLELRSRNLRAHVPAQRAAWTDGDAQTALHTTRVIHNFSLPRILAHLDSLRTVVAAHTALHTTQRVGSNMTFNFWRGVVGKTQNAGEEALFVFVIARQQYDDSIWASLNAFVASLTLIGDEGAPVAQLHAIKAAGVDARRVGAVAADVGQLIMPEARTFKTHAGASVPLFADRRANVAHHTFG